MMDPDLHYLTVHEVAGLLRLSERTVRTAVKSGEIPSMRIGGSIRIPRSAVDTFGETRRPALDAEPGTLLALP